MTKTSTNSGLADAHKTIALSVAGAVRAFDSLCPDAATLLMGMIRVTCRNGGEQAVIAQAAASMQITREAAVRGFQELLRSGLLRQRGDDVLLLHRMFSSYGHELAKRKQGGRGSVGNVLKLVRETA